ncbi:MAG: helix-turn-helix domain-containing protein [Saprospiraceae bacterium]|nr:helix-turn-helix domain-containing protein [Saprospiraceae bacterium]
MDVQQLLLFFLASLGLGLSLFFSFVLLRWKGPRQQANRLLGLLLLFLSLRITKSVFYHFVALPLFIKNLGLAANLAVAPLLYLYGRALSDAAWKWTKPQLLHFIPALAYAILSPVLPNGAATPAWQWLYPLVLGQSFIYAGLSLSLAYRSLQKDQLTQKWYLSITWGLVILWGTYLAIFLTWIPIYLMGALSFSVLMGIWLVLGWREKDVFLGWREKRYQASVLKPGQGAAVLAQIHTLFEEEATYLDPKLSLMNLAKHLDVHPKQLSQAINEGTDHNFIQFINTYRIKHAQGLLLDPDRRSDKIIAIALDSGFGSLSTFNAVFKQATQMTPSAFRKAIV